MERHELTEIPDRVLGSFVGFIRGIQEMVVTAAMVVTNADLFVGRMSGGRLDRYMSKLRERNKPYESPIAGQTGDEPLNLQDAIDKARRDLVGGFY